MNLRITPHRQFEIGQLRSRSQSLRTATLRDQISSGTRIHSPSDDPHAQKLVLSHQSTISHFQTQSRAIVDARALLNTSHLQTRTAQQLVVHARDIGLQSRQLNSQSEADVLAREIDGILQTLTAVANARHNGRYLFSGSRSETRPYQDVAEATEYQGSVDAGLIRIGSAGQIKAYYSGEAVFSTGIDGRTIIQGTTGAVGGSGTASGHGSSQLLVRHTATTYAGSSGIQAGSDSPGNDTVIGVHDLEISDTSGNGTEGTVSLNGGQPVTFTNLDNNLQVTGPRGELIFVDTTAVTPGFTGAVTVSAAGTLSLDGGATTVPIDFDANQTLIDPNGNVRHVDSRGITQTGVDAVRLEGNNDLFETLRELRDDLQDFSSFTTSDWNNRITGHLDRFETANSHLLNVIGEQSVDLQTLDRLQDRGDELRLEAERTLGELNGTDLAEAVLRLQEEQNLTQFTFATLSGLYQSTILDFLR